jgi:thiol-disulfide isomerase/thioredoxin
MKLIFALIIVLSSLAFAFGQGNEQSPIVEKDIVYKDWVYKNVQTGDDMNLRKFTFGKKLVMVVYFAPWCPNWKHDAPFIQSMYEKYKINGFDVIAVGEYEPLDSMKNLLTGQKVTFPVVWESDARTSKQTTSHYEYRKSVGDTRNWGSPWYVFLEVSKLEPTGMVMAKKAPIVNGELIRPDAEKFIREKLGMRAENAVGLARSPEIEVCEPEKKTTTALVKPN